MCFIHIVTKRHNDPYTLPYTHPIGNHGHCAQFIFMSLFISFYSYFYLVLFISIHSYFIPISY